MKKHIALILTLSLILCSLTACHDGGAEDLPNAQGSTTYSTVSDTESSSSDPDSSSADQSPDSTPNEPKEIGIYGETEIPDIPCGDPDFEGKANHMDPDGETAKHLEQCLDSMVFETHTYGEYTISLIGDRVRTDKKNFPDSIYAQGLHVEVKKNGEKGGRSVGFCTSGILTYSMTCNTEYKLLTDKIGSYLDLYELDTPVIAMRYFYKNDKSREVTKAVGFALIEDDEVHNALLGTCEKGTGITLNPDMDLNDPSSMLAFNTKDKDVCSVCVFAADKFRIADGKTLVDDEAGVKYTFTFSDLYEQYGKVYKTELIRSPDSTPNEPKEIGIYGETEIPDIPCGDPDYEGKANTMSNRDALEQCLDSMVFETHTYGEYTVKLVGESVRTDKKNFPDSIYAQGLHVEVEKNGKEIEAFDNYGSLYLLYGTQYHVEYRLFTDKIGSYLDLYKLDTPVIAFRYFFDEDPEREVTKTVSFAMIWDDKLYAKLVGTTVKGTGVEFNPDPDLYPTRDTKKILSLTTSDGLDIEVLFAADEFRIADGKTLIDEKAGIKYTFDFCDPLKVEGKVYKTEWIKSPDSTPNEPKEIGIYGETEIPDIPFDNPNPEGKIQGMDYDEINKITEKCLDSIVLETHTYGEYTISLIGDRVRTDKENFPGSIYAETLRVDVLRNGEKVDNKHECYYTGSGMLTYLEMGYTEFKLFTDKIGSYLDFYELDTPVIAMRYYFDEGREVTKAVGFATIGEDEVYSSLWGSCEKGTGITFNPDSTVNDPGSQLAFNTKDCGCSVSIFAADKFRIADGKTLVDDEAGVKYTFDFSDVYELEGKIYKTEWIK